VLVLVVLAGLLWGERMMHRRFRRWPVLVLVLVVLAGVGGAGRSRCVWEAFSDFPFDDPNWAVSFSTSP